MKKDFWLFWRDIEREKGDFFRSDRIVLPSRSLAMILSMFSLSVSATLAPWPNTFEESILETHLQLVVLAEFRSQNWKDVSDPERFAFLWVAAAAPFTVANSRDRKMAETVGRTGLWRHGRPGRSNFTSIGQP